MPNHLQYVEPLLGAKLQVNEEDLPVEQRQKSTIVIRESLVEGSRSTDQRYIGDNKLLTPKNSYQQSHLALQCLLITSWG